MRDYGKVYTTFWSSKTIRSCTEDGRTLALYLLTASHGTLAGVYRLPDGYACEDLNEEKLGWNAERVSKGFAELSGKGFARRCQATKWVWVIDHFEWNPLENPNQRKAAKKIADSVPDECIWKAEFLTKCGSAIGLTDEEIANCLERVRKASPNQYQEQEQDQEQEQESSREAEPVENLGTDLAGQSSPAQSNSLDSSQTDEASVAAAKRSTSERRENRTAAELVFKHWRVTWDHEGAKFDSKRRKRIEARLAQGFTVEQLCNAITGFRHSAWHTGTDPNGDGKIYDKIETLLRDAGQVEEGMRLHANPPKANGNGHANGSEAFAAWDRAYDHARKGDWRKGVLGDQRIDRVVAYIGGYQRIAMSNNSEVPFFRQQFIKAWKEGAP